MGLSGGLLSGVLHSCRMKVFLIFGLCLSVVGALPHQDRQSGCGSPHTSKDKYCDDENNNAACNFDGGACCGPNVIKTFCKKCQCLQGGSGGGSANKECAKIPSWMKSDLARSDPSTRIVNGKTAPSPIPWQVHLRQGSPTAGFGYFCGGTIIDSKTILTAAHCYHGKNLAATDYFITAGVVHVQDGAGQSAFVEKITLHESYNPTTINNDIAILKLKTPLTFNDKVRQACLPEASFVPTGKAVASGWGLVSQFPDQSPKNLQWVTKPVVTNDKCCQAPFKWGCQQITANMICAGDADDGESTCSGDSGGPLVVPKSSTDDTAVVIGATSFGPRAGCGLQGLPAVYAYVTKYLDWIKPKMES